MTKLRVPCEVYSRIVGYLRPVQNWNAGKQREFEEREMYGISDARQDVEGSGKSDSGDAGG